jgi:hypothetical protein
MEKEFVPYVESLEIKELGFDKPCLGFFLNTGKFYTTAEYPHSIEVHTQNQLGDYNYDSTSAPTWKQAFEFFRDKYKLKFYIREDIWNHWCSVTILEGSEEYTDIEWYGTYEEAELECLKKLIEIVKEKK